MTEFRARVFSGARWTVASRIIAQLVSWPATILIMRLVHPGEYGLVALAGIVTGFLAMLGELGLGAAVVQAPTMEPRTVRAIHGAVIAISVAFAATLMLSAPVFAWIFGEPRLTNVIRVLSLQLAITGFGVVPQALLDRQLRFRESSLALIWGNIFSALLTLTAAWAGLGVWALVVGSLSLAISRAGFAMYYARPLPQPLLDFAALKPFLRFGNHVVAARVLWYWYGQADQAVIGASLPKESLGAYASASQFSMLPVDRAMEALNKVTLPSLASVQDQPATLHAAYLRLVRFALTYSIPACWGLGLVAGDFVSLLLGPKWQAAIVPMQLLCVVAPMRMLTTLQATVVTALGRPQYATWPVMLAVVIVPAGVFVGTRLDGVAGAGWGWIVAFPLVVCYATYLTQLAVGGSLRSALWRFRGPLIAGLAMAAAVLVWQNAVVSGAGHLVRFVTASLLGALAYGFTLWLVDRSVLAEGWATVAGLLGRGQRPAPPAR